MPSVPLPSSAFPPGCPQGWNATCIKAFDRHTAAERKAGRLANDIQDVRCMTDKQRVGTTSG